MGWFRGLKLKLLVILLVSTAALATALYVGFDIKDKQSKTISLLMDQRIPISESIGQAESNMNAIGRYLDSALLEDGEARTRRIEKVELSFKSLFEQLGKLKALKLAAKSMEQVEEIEKRAVTIEPLSQETIAKLRENKPEADLAAKQIILKKVLPTLREMTGSFEIVKKIFAERNLEFNKEAKDNAETAARTMQLVAILSTLFLWTFGLSIAFSVSKKLQTVTSQVDSSSEEVAKSSQQLASSSQQLSSASQQQASALEESSASLQEITGIVESNLKNTEDSVKLARAVIKLTTETNETITSLTTSMDEIKKSNVKVESLAKLIEEIGEKTDLIDEIVFQTKLLSFNASVEAERAGEHGRGFAVVAQEVGNLAQMSGKSAIEIVAIVKAAIKSAQEVSQDTKARVESGYKLCKDTASKMSEVTHSAQQILESSEQILRAFQEQNSGIRQISISVESLNKSTQSNAASSEESAASSATLFDLSQNLKGQVGELFQIVEGKNEGKPAPVHVASTLSAKAKVLSLKKDKKEAAPAPLQRVAGDSAPAKSDKGGWDSL